jgi:metacaspase-1
LLRYDLQYSTEGKINEPNLLAEAGQGLLQSGIAYVQGDSAGALSGILGLVKQAVNTNSGAEQFAKQTRTSPADAIAWSGCKDNQTSADTVEVGQNTGAMSFVSMDL